MTPTPIGRNRAARVAAAGGIAVVVLVTGGVAGHSLRPGVEAAHGAPSPGSSASSPSQPGETWRPTAATAALANTSLRLSGDAVNASGLPSAENTTAPIYLLDVHAKATDDVGTIAESLGMSRREAGGSSTGHNVLSTEIAIYDTDASLGIDYSYSRVPYITYSDARRGPGCNAQVRTCAPSTAPAPTGDAAITQVTRIMKVLGFDLDAFTFSAQALPSATPSTLVWALPASHGVPIDESTLTELNVPWFSGGATWSATVTADGVVRLEAELAELTEVSTVNVLSPAATADRMADPRFALANNFALNSVDTSPPQGTTKPPAGADRLSPGAAIPWRVHHHAWTGATQTWAVQPEVDGRSIAIPAWRFLDGGEDPSLGAGWWSAISVPESALRFVSRVAYLPF